MRPLTIIAIVAIIAVPVVTFYDFNGNSFDITDRQVVLVVTDSMDGDVHDYDIGSFPADTLVMIKYLDSTEVRFLKVGDVISYWDGSILVHHRVVQVNHDSVYVHGDNNHSTEIVAFSDVHGKVVGTNWILGHFIAFVDGNFIVFLGMMFLLCCALIVYAMYPLSLRRKEEAE